VNWTQRSKPRELQAVVRTHRPLSKALNGCGVRAAAAAAGGGAKVNPLIPSIGKAILRSRPAARARSGSLRFRLFEVSAPPPNAKSWGLAESLGAPRLITPQLSPHLPTHPPKSKSPTSSIRGGDGAPPAPRWSERIRGCSSSTSNPPSRDAMVIEPKEAARSRGFL
jgi:hypothetical protein